MLGFRWFRHSDVFNVTSSEDDVFIRFIFGWYRSVCVSVLCPVGFNCWEIKDLIKKVAFTSSILCSQLIIEITVVVTIVCIIEIIGEKKTCRL